MQHNRHAQDPRRAPMKIVKNEPEPEAVAETVASEFDSEEAELDREAEALAQKRTALEDQKRAAQEAEYERKLAQYNAYREEAKNFRATAASETDEPSKKTYIRWALEADANALALAQELGLEIPKELEQAEPKPAKATSSSRFVLALQIGFLSLILYVSYGLFFSSGAALTEKNKDLPAELQTQPYDATSIQKFYLEKFVEFFDLPLALAKLAIFAPFILLYVLPFGKNRKSLFTEFHEELTPFQRCVLTVVFISLFLLHSALSHLVKP